MRWNADDCVAGQRARLAGGCTTQDLGEAASDEVADLPGSDSAYRPVI
jgi:hypothetical protein